jgi:hypothetical protein
MNRARLLLPLVLLAPVQLRPGMQLTVRAKGWLDAAVQIAEMGSC